MILIENQKEKHHKDQRQYSVEAPPYYQMILYNPPPRHTGLIPGGYCGRTYQIFPV